MRALNWLWRGILFVILFAFAYKNRHVVDLYWFFGYQWQAPMIFIVLAVFVAGCITGAMAMLPSWWRHRREAKRRQPESLSVSKPALKEKEKAKLPDASPSTLSPQIPPPPDIAAPRKSAP